MLRIAIADPNDQTRDPLRSLLLGVDFVWLEAECARYEFFLDVVQQSPPDLVIVALDSDRTRAMAMIAQLAAEHPKLPILAISSDNQALLQALKGGAKYFLTQPVVLEELLAALRKTAGETGASVTGDGVPARHHGAQVTAVLGSRGGVGCTTLAVNLACTLAADPGNAVALLDLDLALGDADVSLDLMPDTTLSDLAANIERLDMNFLKRSLVKHEATGLSLLCHPMHLAEIGNIHPDHLQRIINLLKVSYNHLILDLSKSLSSTDELALQMADKILLVAQLELSSLRNAVRILHALSAADDIASKVQVVVNRVGADHVESDISLKKAEATIGKPVFWQVPNDSKAVMGARVAGVPLLQYAPKSKAQQSIGGLAAALCSKHAAQPARRGGWFGK
jgi:pilus assembly protein CpaE